MSKIDDIVVRRVIDAANIVDVVGHFVELKKKGPRYIGLCPFHDDRNATNFSVYNGCYKCFACNASGDAVKFVMDHEHLTFPDAIRWLGNFYGIPTDGIPLNYTPPVRKKPKPLPTFNVPLDVMLRSLRYKRDALVDWICSLPWDSSQAKRIDEALTAYYIGHSRFGHTIFWQVDEMQNVRTGKMMLYQDDGHRAKNADYNFDFVHAALFRDKSLPQYDESKFEVKQCLFGQHLLNAWPNAQVNIVESEKTALLMAIAYGNHAADIWMACGGLYNITREKLMPLIKQHRKIVLFPDRDGIKDWEKEKATIGYDKISIDTTIVTKYWLPEDGEKADIADVVLRFLDVDNRKQYHGRQTKVS